MHAHLRPFFVLGAASFLLFSRCSSEPLVFTSPQSNLQLLSTANDVDQALISKEVSSGDDYMAGRGVTQNIRLAAESYEKAANAGDPAAQNLVGYLYQTGLGVPQSLERAVHWYQLSAANGSLNGKVNLAVAYVWGVGVRADPQLGKSLLNEAAEKGSGTAAAFLGDMYLSGIGIPADMQKAIAFYQQGVRRHSYYAQYKLALYLAKPYSHPQNIQRSVDLLRKSIGQGYVPAMYMLGLIAVNHPESNVPHEEALALLRDASEAGSWRASAVLAILSRDGKWVQKNKREAYRYFKRAALQENGSAESYVHKDLQALLATLDLTTVAKLDNDAAEWQSKHPVPLQLIFTKGQKTAPFSAYALSAPGPGQHAGGLVSPVPD